MFLTSLPDAVLISVLTHLDVRSVGNVLNTCKELYSLRDRPELLALYLVEHSDESITRLLTQRNRCSIEVAGVIRACLGSAWESVAASDPDDGEEADASVLLDGRHALLHWIAAWAASIQHDQFSRELLTWALSICPASAATGAENQLSTTQGGMSPGSSMRMGLHAPALVSQAGRVLRAGGHNYHSSVPEHVGLRLKAIAHTALESAAAAGQWENVQMVIRETAVDPAAVVLSLAKQGMTLGLALLLLPDPELQPSSPTTTSSNSPSSPSIPAGPMSRPAVATSSNRSRRVGAEAAASSPPAPLPSYLRAAGGAAGVGTCPPTGDTATPGSLQPDVSQGGESEMGNDEGWRPEYLTPWEEFGPVLEGLARPEELTGLGLSLSHDVFTTALGVAAHGNHVQCLRLLMGLSSRDLILARGIHALQQAAEGNALDAARYLLLVHGTPANEQQSAALRSAACNGHAEMVELLLSRGADLAAVNYQALHYAATEGHEQVVRVLMEAGCPAGAAQGIPLAAAAMAGHTGVAQLLLEAGADPNAPMGRPLASAAFSGHTPVVELLLEWGADPHANDEEALCLAAHNRHLGTARAIIRHCADVRCREMRAARLLTCNPYGRAACDVHVAHVAEDAAHPASEMLVAQGGTAGAGGQGLQAPGPSTPHSATAAMRGVELGSGAGAGTSSGAAAGSAGDGMAGITGTMCAPRLPHVGMLLRACPECPRRDGGPVEEVLTSGALDAVMAHFATVALMPHTPEKGCQAGNSHRADNGSTSAPSCSADHAAGSNGSSGSSGGNGSCGGSDTQDAFSVGAAMCDAALRRVLEHAQLGEPEVQQLIALVHDLRDESLTVNPAMNSGLSGSGLPGQYTADGGTASATASGTASGSSSGRVLSHFAHRRCHSTRELWLAARTELAQHPELFHWYSIFCDGCGQVPVVGVRYHCRDCPRYFTTVQPPMQGYDLCEACLHTTQADPSCAIVRRPHATHKHHEHTLVQDMPPVEFSDLSDHSQMLVWLNCYACLHPEVDPIHLHHLAVMHVNKDPRRTSITTEQLVELLCPGATPEYWQGLLPPMCDESEEGEESEEGRSERSEGEQEDGCGCVSAECASGARAACAVHGQHGTCVVCRSYSPGVGGVHTLARGLPMAGAGRDKASDTLASPSTPSPGMVGGSSSHRMHGTAEGGAGCSCRVCCSPVDASGPSVGRPGRRTSATTSVRSMRSGRSGSRGRLVRSIDALNAWPSLPPPEYDLPLELVVQVPGEVGELQMQEDGQVE